MNAIRFFQDQMYVKPPGFTEQNDLLNVLSLSPMNQWYAFDPLVNSSDLDDSYYHWSNLYVGAEIDVYSRKIVLYNCDKFTKQYYADYGLGMLHEFSINALIKSMHDIYLFN